VLDALISLSTPRSNQRYADNRHTRQLHRATSAQVGEQLLVNGDDHTCELFRRTAKCSPQRFLRVRVSGPSHSVLKATVGGMR
jgi:hypothetical protein